MDEQQHTPDPLDKAEAGDAGPDDHTAAAITAPTEVQVGVEPTHLPPTPPGGRLLSADEAVELLVTGGHPDSDLGSVHLDATLVDALRAGRIIACRLPDGQLAFTPVTRPRPN